MEPAVELDFERAAELRDLIVKVKTKKGNKVSY